jgi:hypothetical protein
MCDVRATSELPWTLEDKTRCVSCIEALTSDCFHTLSNLYDSYDLTDAEHSLSDLQAIVGILQLAYATPEWIQATSRKVGYAQVETKAARQFGRSSPCYSFYVVLDPDSSFHKHVPQALPSLNRICALPSCLSLLTLCIGMP